MMISNTLSHGVFIPTVILTVKTMSEDLRPKVCLMVDHEVVLINSLEMMEIEKIGISIQLEILNDLA